MTSSRSTVVEALTDAWKGERIEWPDLWLTMAHLVARRSRCDRDQVGAVLVGYADHRLLSVGYNGAPRDHQDDDGRWCRNWCQRAATVPPGQPAGPSYDNCPSTHAEMNCLLRAPEHDEPSVMYVSVVPCMGCAKMIAAARSTRGIIRVVASNGGPGAVYRDQNGAVRFLRTCGIDVHVLSNERNEE